MAPTNKKRLWDNDQDSDSDYENERSYNCNNWPRFLVMESSNDDLPLSKLSPFAIQKGFQAVARTLKSIKRLRDGSFLVECGKRAQAQNLLWTNRFIDRPVRVTIHKTLNSSQGVIRCRDLADMTEVEIQDELKDQGVAGVNRVTLKKEGKVIPTNTLFLTFGFPELPKEITVGYLKVKVALFVPNLMRCFNCNKFGHTSQRCKVAAKCTCCGKDKHEGQCEGPKLCSNCNGPHASSAKDCPVWQKEEEIQRVCVEKRISFPSDHIAKTDLINLIEQLPSPFVLLGDFNGHSPVWGNESYNSRGQMLEDLFSEMDLCILNDGSSTYIHPATSSTSALDFSICGPSLVLDYEWNIHEDLCGSDHFPVILTSNTVEEEGTPNRWILKRQTGCPSKLSVPLNWRRRRSCLPRIPPVSLLTYLFKQQTKLYQKHTSRKNFPKFHGLMTAV